MKTVLITGASGFLGYHLVERFIERGDTRVIAILGRPGDKENVLPDSDRVMVYPCSALFKTNFGHVDTLIHTAFSRGDSLPGLTRSIELTKQIIELVNSQDIDSILNISSQGVYRGLRPGEKVDEAGFVEPNTAYGMAKWAVENMLELGSDKPYCNIRMASLSANARFLEFFVDCVVEGRDITVTAPEQYASVMDVSDAVRGILSVERLNLTERDYVYNMGPGEHYSILEYATMINEIGQEFGFPRIRIRVADTGKCFAICMDCSKLMKQTGWEPELSVTMLLRRMFNNRISKC